jgi:hypothetical protein
VTQLSQAEAPSLAQPTAQPLQTDNEELQSASEKYMASLWSEIIGVGTLKLSDTFPDVGGNSITLPIIVNRIRSERGVSIEPQLFFDPDRSSLSELAKELDRLLDNPDAGDLPAS